MRTLFLLILGLASAEGPDLGGKLAEAVRQTRETVSEARALTEAELIGRLLMIMREHPEEAVRKAALSQLRLHALPVASSDTEYVKSFYPSRFNASHRSVLLNHLRSENRELRLAALTLTGELKWQGVEFIPEIRLIIVLNQSDPGTTAAAQETLNLLQTPDPSFNNFGKSGSR